MITKNENNAAKTNQVLDLSYLSYWERFKLAMPGKKKTLDTSVAIVIQILLQR